MEDESREADTDDRTVKEIELTDLLYRGLRQLKTRTIKHDREGVVLFSSGGHVKPDIKMAWKGVHNNKAIARYDNKTAAVMYKHAKDIRDALVMKQKHWKPAVNGIFQQVCTTTVPHSGGILNVYRHIPPVCQALARLSELGMRAFTSGHMPTRQSYICLNGTH